MINATGIKKVFYHIIKDRKKFESSNKTIALNMLYVTYNSEKIRHGYISKHNSTRKSQGILLMMTDNKIRYYLAVNNLSALFCKIKSKHDGDFYCLNCLNSLRTENNRKHVNACKNA